MSRIKSSKNVVLFCINNDIKRHERIRIYIYVYQLIYQVIDVPPVATVSLRFHKLCVVNLRIQI